MIFPIATHKGLLSPFRGSGPLPSWEGGVNVPGEYKQKEKVIGLCVIFEGLAGAAFFFCSKPESLYVSRTVKDAVSFLHTVCYNVLQR